MKKTDALIRITSLVVFIALAAYLIVYIVSRSSNSVQTALTVTATMSDSAPMSGLVIRNELVIRSGEPYISVTAADGSKVAAGETVAVAYSSEEALERATRLNALDREIDDVSAALNRSGTGLASGSLGESVYSAITGLSACIRGGNLSELDSRSSTLAGILFPSGNSDNTATDEYLAQLKKEYADLRKTAAGDTEDITVGESGTFSNLVDGYEGVDPDYVKSLTPSELREIINADRMVDDTSIGKLITSYDWYYVGIIPWEDGQHLMEDTWVKLSFGRYYSGELDAQIEWVGRAENGQQVVLFRIEQGQADMLAVRAVSAELVYEEYTGLRVPLRGLYRYYAGYMSDEDGQALHEGDSVQLMLGEAKYDAFVSEIGSASRYGELPPGVESDSEQDTRPTHRRRRGRGRRRGPPHRQLLRLPDRHQRPGGAGRRRPEQVEHTGPAVRVHHDRPAGRAEAGGPDLRRRGILPAVLQRHRRAAGGQRGHREGHESLQWPGLFVRYHL